jgi:chromosome segregation ATPase
VQVILDEFKQVISQMSLPSAEEIGLETPKNGHIEAKIGIAQESITRVRKSLHVASTAFVDGILDAEEYQVQKERLNVQIAQLNRQIEQLQRDLLSAEHEAQRAKRTEDFIADALTRLDGPDTREVNAWLRRSVTIYIRDGHIEAIDIL